MKNKIVLFTLSYIMWMLLGWPFDWQHAVLGLFISGFIIFLTADLFPVGARNFFQLRRYYWFIFYVGLMTWECIRANINTGLLVMNPSRCLRPGIVRIKTGLKTGMAMAFLANSISLSSGALSVDVAPENGILYVHWMNVVDEDAVEATRMLAARFESVLKRIFE
jgi:multicomponent Na+:H+ antiporter subunit E